MAAGDASTAARVERLGMSLLQPQQGLQALRAALQGVTHVPPVLAAVPFLWPKFISRQAPSSVHVFSEFQASIGSDDSSVSSGPSSRAISGRATSAQQTPAAHAAKPAASTTAVLSKVQAAVQAVLGSDVPPDAPLMSSGLDSLGAVELRNSLEGALGVQLPPTLTFDYPTAEAIARFIASSSQPSSSSQAKAPAGVNAEQNDQQAGTGLLLFSEAGQALGSNRRLPLQRHPKQSGKKKSTHILLVAASTRLPGTAGTHSGSSSWIATMSSNKHDQVQPVPLSRWDPDAGWVSSLSDGSAGAPRFGAWLPSADRFDAPAFKLSSQEAVLMDPQQRLLLECTGEALATCGLTAASDSSASQAGVYMGVSSVDYLKLALVQRQQLQKADGGDANSVTAYSATGVHACSVHALSLETVYTAPR
jgi:acyl carrier protein